MIASAPLLSQHTAVTIFLLTITEIPLPGYWCAHGCACMSATIGYAARPAGRATRLSLALLSNPLLVRQYNMNARVLSDSFPTISTVADVTAAAQQLYSSSFLASPAGPSISHISSLHLVPVVPHSTARRLYTLRVDDKSPRSPYDWFALNLSRARADLIVLTGAILRDEPQLTGNVLAEYKAALMEWRRQVWGRQHPPSVCVLTAGPVDFTHPLFGSTEGDVFVYCTSQYFHTLHGQLQAHSSSRAPLCSASSTQHITVPLRHLQALTPPSTASSQPSNYSSDNPIRIISPYFAPSLLTLLQHFRHSHSNIAVECGPSTTLPHYARHSNRHIDTLLLSIHEGELSGSVEERCVVPGKELWEKLGWSGDGREDSVGFVLTEEWVRQQYDCVSAARQGDWCFEWHRSKHRPR